MDNNGLCLRKLATVLGVSQPFLSQIRAGKRPMPEAKMHVGGVRSTQGERAVS